jgi:hypothetical protein
MTLERQILDQVHLTTPCDCGPLTVWEPVTFADKTGPVQSRIPFPKGGRIHVKSSNGLSKRLRCSQQPGAATRRSDR